ncbi:hypothetical protein LTR85_003553 [Meristemomyces frigidus]|nr:hypothetical protein LTR85_003553 [Meristemomyces frigidus]
MARKQQAAKDESPGVVSLKTYKGDMGNQPSAHPDVFVMDDSVPFSPCSRPPPTSGWTRNLSLHICTTSPQQVIDNTSGSGST